MNIEAKYSVPCLFGLEGLAAEELRRMDLRDVAAENGRVRFSGDLSALIRANLRLRTGERVLLTVGSVPCPTFDALFEGVKAMPWERYIPVDGAFPVKGHCLDSRLHSVPDCQSIIKKAIVERLKQKYRTEWFRETGEKYQIRFSVLNDVAEISIDTSGTGLHKRGYRPVGNAAPLRETLAAAMVEIARYRGRDVFRDPFCGSGTIPIEAALIARNRAPGLNRRFDAMSWRWMPKDLWKTLRDEAQDLEYHGNYDILGSDVDPECVEISQANAKRAGVSEIVRFLRADAREFAPESDRGIVVSNPPYGERVMEQREAERLYRQFGAAVKHLDGWGFYLLSSHTEFERAFGRTADRKRKLYNGMIKCDLFQYRPRANLAK